MRRQAQGVLLAALTACAAACGASGDPEPAAEPDNSPAVTLIALSELRAAIPQLPDWSRGEITTVSGTAADPSAKVLVAYSKESQHLGLEIIDTGGDERVFESLESMAGSGVNQTVGNGYFKGTVVSDFPAVESLNTVEHLGELSLLVRRRFIVHVTGTGLDDAAPMRALAEAVDMSRLR